MTSAKAVTLFFSIPASANRLASVAFIMVNGKAEDMPRASEASGAGST